MLKLIGRVFSKRVNGLSNESRKSILNSISEHDAVIKSLKICEQDSTTRNEIQKEQRLKSQLENML